MAEREVSTELSVKSATDMITTQLEWNIKVAARKEEGINVSKYKRKHGWINLKKIKMYKMDCKYGLKPC